ncbi:MAG: hypothetical protein RLN86_03715 [Cyclobacteriaceae bacterium]
MQASIIFLLSLLSLTSAAQTTAYDDFKLEEQQIIFQKVIEKVGINYEKLNDYYSSLPYVSNIEVKTNAINFIVKDIEVDYLKFQFSQVNTPLIMQSGKFSGKVSVSVRDGRYRVTFQEIQLTGEIVYKSIKEKENLTDYASRNSGTQLSPDWCRPNMLGLLGKAFTDKLEFKSDEDEEW